MGCFAGTCKMTDLAIFEHDEIIAIKISSPNDWGSFYNIFDNVVRRYWELKDSVNKSQWEKEIRNEVENEMIQSETLYSRFHPIEKVYVGTYTDYGGVKEFDEDYDDLQFFHKWAVEKAIGKSVGNIGDVYTMENEIEMLSLVSEIYYKLHLLRKSALDCNLLGVQHDGIDEMEFQKQMMLENIKWIDERILKFKKDGEDDEY